MKGTTNWLTLLTSLSIVGMGAAASANQIANIEESGRGSLTVNGNTAQRFRTAVVKLNSDHSALIQVYGTVNHGFHGTWTSTGTAGYTLNINDIDSRSGSATGYVRVAPSGRDFSHLELTGNSAAIGNNFTLKFDSSAAQGMTSRYRGDMVDNGTGVLRIGNGQYDLRQIHLKMDPGGAMTLRLGGDRDVTYYGTWSMSKGRGDTVNLAVNRSATGSATGAGTAVLTSNRRSVAQIGLNGNDNGAQMSAQFSSRYGGYNVGTSPNTSRVHRGMGRNHAGAELDARRNGNGNVVISQQTFAMNEAEVILYSTGKAEIVVRGDTEKVFLGTWRRQTNNQIGLTINRATGYRQASGSGTVNVNWSNKTFTNLNLNGVANNDQFSVSFTSS
jgi:hypothetical protein